MYSKGVSGTRLVIGIVILVAVVLAVILVLTGFVEDIEWVSPSREVPDAPETSDQNEGADTNTDGGESGSDWCESGQSIKVFVNLIDPGGQPVTQQQVSLVDADGEDITTTITSDNGEASFCEGVGPPPKNVLMVNTSEHIVTISESEGNYQSDFPFGSYNGPADGGPERLQVEAETNGGGPIDGEREEGVAIAETTVTEE